MPGRTLVHLCIRDKDSDDHNSIELSEPKQETSFMSSNSDNGVSSGNKSVFAAT
jgi:hypothetical protein